MKFSPQRSYLEMQLGSHVFQPHGSDCELTDAILWGDNKEKAAANIEQIIKRSRRFASRKDADDLRKLFEDAWDAE